MEYHEITLSYTLRWMCFIVLAQLYTFVYVSDNISKRRKSLVNWENSINQLAGPAMILFFAISNAQSFDFSSFLATALSLHIDDWPLLPTLAQSLSLLHPVYPVRTHKIYFKLKPSIDLYLLNKNHSEMRFDKEFRFISHVIS